MDENLPISEYSKVSLNPLKNEANIKTLNAFEEIIKTSIGPYGHLKYISNSEGGVGILSSSSMRLLNSVSFKNIILKLIVKSMHNHLVIYKNGGLVSILLVLQLIKYSAAADIFLPLAGKLFEYFGNLFIQCLNIKQNNCIFEFDWSKLDQIKIVVETILRSKPQCCFSEDSVKHLSCLIIKTHLNSVPVNNSTVMYRKINFVTMSNNQPINSKLFNGLLIKFPEVSKDFSCFQWEIQKHAGRNNDICQKRFKIVLYSISLSGDAEFPVDKIEVSNGVDVWETIFIYLQNLVNRIIEKNIHVFACQKVVHPTLRLQLEKADILVLDRLGFEVSNNLKILSGSCNYSFFGEISVGYVTDISIEKLGTRKEDPKFLLLSNTDKPFWTFLIRNHCTQAVEETKIVCEQALDTLWRMLKEPSVCCGAGCTEFFTGQMVEKKVLMDVETIKSEFGCSSSQVLEALQIFLKSIADISVAINQGSALDFAIETHSNHLWKLENGSFPSNGATCVCGAKKADSVANSGWKFLNKTVGEFFVEGSAQNVKCTENKDQPVFLDELSCKVSAFSVAFEVASLLLRSTLCIQS